MNKIHRKYVLIGNCNHGMLTSLVIIMLLCPGFTMFAQEQGNHDKYILTRERTDRMIEYSENIDYVEDSLWFVGKEYKFINSSSKGTPFFFDEVNFNGTLVFNGKKYHDLSLFYDLVKDALVMYHSSRKLGFVFINLNKAWVQEFTLEKENLAFKFLPDSHFEFLDPKLPEGYFEVVYEGDMILLYKSSKKVSFETFDNNYYKYTFSQKTYLIRNNHTYDITKKKAFLSIFKEHKKQVKSFMRDSNIIYKNPSRTQLISLIKYCETLS